MSLNLLIGLDDTDNLTSRGTGYRARCLAAELEQAGMARVTGVTRHQLLVDDAIPYTSHNSSACISTVVNNDTETAPIIDLCRDFLSRNAAEGSDVGLCITPYTTAEKVRDFGYDAQRTVLQRLQAEDLAQSEDIYLVGLTGDHQGKIGALAAVGLHSAGDDGRYIWVRGIRERKEETVTLAELINTTGVETVVTLNGNSVNDPDATIYLGPWPRPVRINGQATLLVEKNNGGNTDWKVLDKEAIKTFRP